ncbi:MAG: ATP-binding protein [Candidatus Nitrosocosmicus sp.]|jgi:signal transduction histidine kinase|uniref:sensor histidine kinase n=1 Tax=Candidatus Nitrosocosmicus agrestis TaxID=2563600 RepID=UPI00122E3DC4|nr:sensor histidine kinase [Candidatus Nitrosocosmicus sp. SS]KAA2279599.1 sensor histidine kinase [Candidatus Nitrosocosmicus sp. SS]KAF0868248.1 sensor histidine kinase [Candidatus Nitrosocosmicus sp. SS]MDR4489891.1 sensor histidine kinase [Candidatus Nitrosocosmicus sp.]
MLSIILSRNNVFLLILVIGVGVSLSILSYHYSGLTADQISEIASSDIRSNAIIETDGLSKTLLHIIDPVSTNLEILSKIVNYSNIDETKIIIDAVQNSTKSLTEGYYWIDENGRIVSISNVNSSIVKSYSNIDLSNREYFVIPKETHASYYSSAIESIDKIPRLYISFPILDNSDADNFKGVIVASIKIHELGRFLQSELAPQVAGNVGLMDKNGVIIYGSNPSLIGKYYLGEEFQSLVPEEIRGPYNSLLARSLKGFAGAEDLILMGGNKTTITYQPVFIGGKYLWTLFVSSPHQLAAEVGVLINNQKNFSTLMILIIGAVALGIAFLILSWNKRLESAVNARTIELRDANNSLINYNKLLESANEKLSIHDRMQKEFINIAAHELRTPIMPILGDAIFLEKQFEDGKTEVKVDREQVSSIIRNAKRLRRLASDILDITKIESQSLKLNKERFNLNDIIISCISDIKAQIISSDPDQLENISIDYVQKDVFIFADKNRITQVIFNLLSNSVKFTEKGSISISVELGNDIHGNNYVTTSIRDTGHGIDPEIIPRLFTKFASKSFEGTGLGLFISKSIIIAHGGKIWAENNVDSGATFYFRIPQE